MTFPDRKYKKITCTGKIYFPMMVFFVLLFFSCSEELHLAKQFVADRDTINILLLKTDVIIKKNMKINADELPANKRDSLALAESVILKNLVDTTFVNLLFSGLTDGMNKKKFRVFLEERVDTFLLVHPAAYIFYLAQMEIEESTVNYTDSAMYDSTMYYQQFDLNSIDLNLWYELSEQNGDQKTSKVLFSSASASDQIDGYFHKAFFELPKYYYTRKDITISDIYLLTSSFGNDNAGYIYDFFMNDYIYKNYKGNKKPKYLHYNSQTGKIYPSGYHRFIFM